ncbi:complement regulator-acquiring protein (plasmid) [Borreliella turdi]|uniref:complement regulator-acquiring protein n=1 Tax=Borreliella turdi TaxID=57863 RepID=UPI00264A0F1C|nr:complement regulator-acquiring protein [Borreliella turdi]WKC78510.1 complement regulator-acquiring protein [Borreliella turdi]
MRKPTIYKILTLYKIILLASCSFYSKSNNPEEIANELQSNPIPVIEKENAKNIQILQKNRLLSIEKEAAIKNFTQRLNENEKLINKIEPYITIYAPKINKDIQKIEPIDCFGINKNLFPENTKENFLNLDLKDSQIRRLFFSSLDYDENKIKKLISILAETSSSNGYHYTVIGLVFWKGFKTQESFEKAVNHLNKNNQKRLMLNFETKKVKDIQEKFEKLLQHRNGWIKIVDDIINEYNNSLKNKHDKIYRIILGEKIRLGYEHKLNADESMQIAHKIERLLQDCCDHIHY